MIDTRRVRALVPVKHFAAAKQRLGGVLSREECAALARHMLTDVLTALRDATRIDRILLLGQPEPLAAIAHPFKAQCIAERATGDLNARLAAATAALEPGEGPLLIVPGDLPALTGEAIDELLARCTADVTVCMAARDRGTNALVLEQAAGFPYSFGHDSAAAHLGAASARGLTGEEILFAPFARDIDNVDDLLWLCKQRMGRATDAWLDASGVRERLLGSADRAVSA